MNLHLCMYHESVWILRTQWALICQDPSTDCHSIISQKNRILKPYDTLNLLPLGTVCVLFHAILFILVPLPHLRVKNYCIMHLQEDVDAGAILVQESVQIEQGDTEETLQERVKLTEHKVFPKALTLVATGKVSLDETGNLVWKQW